MNVFVSTTLQLPYSLIQLLRVLKSPPDLRRHIPKRLLKPPIGIFVSILHLRHIRHLPNKHRLHPPGIHPTDIAIGFRIALRAVAYAQNLAVGKPGVYLLDAATFIRFGALGQGGEEAAEVHP